jgi:hypothetical protein
MYDNLLSIMGPKEGASGTNLSEFIRLYLWSQISSEKLKWEI